MSPMAPPSGIRSVVIVPITTLGTRKRALGSDFAALRIKKGALRFQIGALRMENGALRIRFSSMIFGNGALRMGKGAVIFGFAALGLKSGTLRSKDEQRSGWQIRVPIPICLGVVSGGPACRSAIGTVNYPLSGMSVMNERQGLLPMPVTPAQVEAAEAQILEQSKRIEFYLTDYSVELLATKMNTGEFVIPPYQREDTWEPDRKSRFVESLLMGLPIPFLFFWERPETGKLEIVDGSQRLRTIEQFLLGDLEIGPLQVLTELEGMKFRDLPEARQRKLKNRSIRGIVLNEHADEQARFDIFERINTGSKVANKAEVRRGALVGPFLTLVIELAKDNLFAELAPVPEKSVAEREREELVTRFFAYGDGLEGYRDKPATFLFDYAKRMNSSFANHPDLRGQYADRFRSVLRFVKQNFPLGFRRAAAGTATPRARFEAIAIGSYLALKQDPGLETRRVDVTGWVGGEEFASVVGSDGANAIGRLRSRIHFVRDRLLGG